LAYAPQAQLGTAAADHEKGARLVPCRNKRIPAAVSARAWPVSSLSATITAAALAQNCDRARRNDRFAQQHIALILDGTGCNAEAFFANLKCTAYGQFHQVSEAHLHRYLAEADFKCGTRGALGYDDVERVVP